MSCEQNQELINAYVDGELDLVHSLDLERHLRDCQACSKSHAGLLALRAAVQGVYQEAPADLQKHVVSALRKDQKSEARTIAVPWRSVAFASSIALLVLLSWGAYRILSGPSSDEMLAHEVVSSHIRSLMSDHLTDVPSSDQHTVKPWFNGKLDFSPPVIDLDDHDFTLVGGRLDYVSDRPVAALVYQRRMHMVNLFIWPSTDKSSDADQVSTFQGYNTVYWKQSDMNCWAVSDLNMDELREFTKLLKTRSSR
ncbi:MAG TPA: anti-sigma factor [Blastocatellia bacterium]|nr:anti-sigma factor [Blastocatellia bacterium]